MTQLGFVTQFGYDVTCFRCEQTIKAKEYCVKIPEEGIMHVNRDCVQEKRLEAMKMHPTRRRND